MMMIRELNDDIDVIRELDDDIDVIKERDDDIDEENISTAHRLPFGKQPDRTRATKFVTQRPIIIVPFVNRQKKNEVYINRFIAKNLENFSIKNQGEFVHQRKFIER